MSKNSSIAYTNDLIPQQQDTGIKNYRSESEAKAFSLWTKFIELLSDSLKLSEINTWFSVITPKSFENNILTIKVPSEDYYSLIDGRYNKIISNIVESFIGPD